MTRLHNSLLGSFLVICSQLLCNCAKEAVPAKSSEPSEAKPAASSEGKEPANSKCPKATRNGTYKVQLQGISSNCPKLGDYEEQLEDGVAKLGPDCNFDKPDQWKNSDCTVERMFTCKDASGSSTRTILVSSQSEADGSILSGILSIKKSDKNGAESCQGTYRFIASRQ